MTINGTVQILVFFVALFALAIPLGSYMARVYDGTSGVNRVFGPLEHGIYRLLGTREDAEMGWKIYALTMLLFNLVGLLAVYGLQRFQPMFPFNPQGLGPVTPDSSFNTAISFASNTNWQGYSGEVTMSYLTQMLGLTVQNFVSAATGMAVLIALIRGLRRHTSHSIGNFWVDLTRSTLYILLPLSLVLSLVQVSQGVVQSFQSSQTVTLPSPTTDADGNQVTQQMLPLGPASSQIAIKQLGTNGGGFFNTNSAHPFENPSPLSNILEALAILLIPAALVYTFGVMIGDKRQAWAILAAMTLILLPLVAIGVVSEQVGNPLFPTEVDQQASGLQSGGNMEGKEVRFGIVNSALWAAITTAASNGSVNSMHDSYTPLGGLVPMFLMQLGEVIFGGVGSGLYGMLIFAIIAVFVAGLMVGRTPEYLGKKIEAYEIKMASLVILVPSVMVLGGTALALTTSAGRGALYDASVAYTSVYNPGAHGFSEVLYAFTSQGNNNGSAFAGLGANNPFWNLTGGVAMLASRYWLAIPVLAIAGSLAVKKQVPAGPGTLATHSPLFIAMLIGVVIIVGALTFIPALALGPIVEHLLLYR